MIPVEEKESESLLSKLLKTGSLSARIAKAKNSQDIYIKIENVNAKLLLQIESLENVSEVQRLTGSSIK